MKLQVAIVGFALACGTLHGQYPGEELRYAVVLTRHGVRSPTWTAERLNQYSAKPWPEWNVAPGELTPHGRALMKLMGAYYREYFASLGLLKTGSCAAYFWADTDQRTIETARALSEGLLPSCSAPIHSAGEDAVDPLFDPIAAGELRTDPKLARAAILGRVGPQLESLIELHRPAFDALEQVLKKRITDQPIELTGGKGAIAMTGALSTASTLTENLLLEYCEGFRGDKLGWGRLDAAKLQQILELHTSYAELVRRTPYLAGARGSKLLNHILNSMDQSKQSPDNSVLFISGHDTNISNVSGILRLSWLLPGYQPDDAPPGGALVFTLWRSKSASTYSVRLQFIAQTLNQMRDAAPLTLAHPPAVRNLFVPGCSTADAGYPCEWNNFKRTAYREGVIFAPGVTTVR